MMAKHDPLIDSMKDFLNTKGFRDIAFRSSLWGYVFDRDMNADFFDAWVYISDNELIMGTRLNVHGVLQYDWDMNEAIIFIPQLHLHYRFSNGEWK